MVATVEDPVLFRARVLPLLCEREAENNLILGILDDLTRPTAGVRRSARLYVDEEGGLVTAAGVMTPPFNLVLTRATPGAIERIADHLANQRAALPGVLAPVDTADRFAAHWAARTGVSARPGRDERIYELTQVTSLPMPQGRFRAACIEDLPRIVEWCRSFMVETGAQMRPAEQLAEERLSGGRLFVWETTEPVSMACWQGPTPNGVRISLVYTARAQRGRGYASACVAALSQRLLDDGKRFCFLFADLANPTSNKIYQRVGYVPVCDAKAYRFKPAAR